MTVLKCLYLLCCMFCMVLIGEWTYRWSVNDWKRYVIAILIYFAGFSVHFIRIDTLFPVFIFFYIGEFLAWLLICKGRFKDKMLKMLGIFYGLDALELSIHAFFKMTFNSLLADEVLDLLVILLITGVFAIITRQKWYRNIIDYLKALSVWKLILILCILVGGSAVIAFGNVMQKSINSIEFTTIFRVIMAMEMCAVAISVIWLIVESYEKKYYLEQNALKEEYIQIQKNYYKTIYEKETEMRRFRHDITSQLGLLKIMMEQGELEKAKNHLESINREFSEVSFQKIHIGDELLDAIISMMNQKASEKGIELEVKGKINNQQEKDIYELCTIFSNAMSNAMESCVAMECTGPVTIKVLEHNEMLCCVFENPATKEMYQEILQEGTSKQDKKNHGYGVGNIKRAVLRLDGNMEYRYDSGKIILEVFI